MKSTKKIVSILLSVLMLTTCLSATFVSADAAATTDALCDKYATNPDNQVGVEKSITVDGTISDWDSSMLIAQGAANDDPRVYRDNSMYEVPIDQYAMYACWDNDNLYLMWEMTNVQDVVAPNDDYPLSQGILYQTMNVPFFIAVDTGKEDAVGNNGQLQTGGTLWNSNITVANEYNRMIAISTNGANGPYVYSGDSTGLNAKEIYNAKTSGITFKYGLGILEDSVNGINGGYGVNHNRVIGDMCDDSADWVDFNTLGHNSDKMDFHYEMAIPLDTLGVTASDVKNNGIGVMNIATMGKSGMDSLPYDTAMNDNADLPDTESQAFNSYEKSDEDDVTASFARVGKLDGDQPVTRPTTQPTTAQPATTAPATQATVKPTTAQPTTVKPTTASESLTVNATSNICSSSSLKVENSDTVTVSYDLKSAMNLVNGQWSLSFDTSKLSFDASKNADIMPYITGEYTHCVNGQLKGNFSNATSLFDFSTSRDFVNVTFDVIGSGTTALNLNVEELSVGFISNDILNYQNAVVNSAVKDLSNVSGFSGSSISGTSAVTTTVPPTQATTVKPTTPATTAPVTQATTSPVTADTLKVNATSNFFPTATQTYNKADNTVTVTYKLTSSMNLINSQWCITYDNTKLSYSAANNQGGLMPAITGGAVINTKITNKIKGNFTNLALYDFSTEKDFIKVTFNVVGTGETTVDLDVQYLGVAYLDNSGDAIDQYVVNNSVVKDVTSIAGFENESHSTKTLLSTPTAVATTTVQPTTAKPTTVQPTTAPVTQPTQPTTNPDTKTLKVNATSNILSPVSQTYNSSDKTVTVSYKLQSSMKLVNGQWSLTYDSTKLSYSNANNTNASGTGLSIMPNITGSGIINTSLTNRIKGNFSSLSLYDFTTEKDFVKVTFGVIGTGETTINFDVQYLGVGYVDNSGETVENYVVDDSILQNLSSVAGFENETLNGQIILSDPTTVDIMYGDVNNDKTIDVSDATIIQKYAAMKMDIDADMFKRADVNFDGTANVSDVTLIQKYIAKKITSFT